MLLKLLPSWPVNGGLDDLVGAELAERRNGKCY